MGDRAHPISIAMPPLMPRLGVAADDRVNENFDAGASRGVGERAARSVSPEEFRMGSSTLLLLSSSSSSSSSSGIDGRWEDEGALVVGDIPSSTVGVEMDNSRNAGTSGTIPPAPCTIKSSAISDNEAGDNDGYFDAPSTSGDVQFVPSAGGGDPQSNEITECNSVLETNNGDGDDDRRDRHPHGRDSPPPIGVSFRDIIGHGQAKLRLDEALLPLALPHQIAASVLTGE